MLLRSRDAIVGYVTGEAKEPPLRPTFDRRIKLEFHGAKITSDGGLLAYRELDDALGLTDMAITMLLDGRRGKNTRHKLSGLFRQAVFGRLAGYEDVNDAERLARDPAMRAIVGRDGFDRAAASSSQMVCFETEWLATDANLEALTDLSGAWIDQVHSRKPPDGIILNMDSERCSPRSCAGSTGSGRVRDRSWHKSNTRWPPDRRDAACDRPRAAEKLPNRGAQASGRGSARPRGLVRALGPCLVYQNGARWALRSRHMGNVGISERR